VRDEFIQLKENKGRTGIFEKLAIDLLRTWSWDCALARKKGFKPGAKTGDWGIPLGRRH
jgi:hypothetical protein